MESQDSHPKPRRRLGLIVAGVLALAAGSALVIAHGGGSSLHGGGHAARHGMDFTEMSEHFQVHVKHVLAEVDATPEQQARIDEIVQAAAKDLKTLHEQNKGGFAELHQLFTAPAIDRGRLEQLRARHIAAMDAASQRCTRSGTRKPSRLFASQRRSNLTSPWVTGVKRWPTITRFGQSKT